MRLKSTRGRFHQTNRTLAACAIALALSATLCAAQPSTGGGSGAGRDLTKIGPSLVRSGGIAGEWDIEMEFDGNARSAKVSFSSEGGKLTGKWSSQRGEDELQNVEFENGSLSFTRSFGGGQFELNFEGKIDGNSLTGKFVIPQGEAAVTGSRAGGASLGDVLGRWEIDWNDSEFVELGFSLIPGPGILALAEKDAGLVGTWSDSEGDGELSAVRFVNGHITFIRRGIIDGEPFRFGYKGVAEGDKMRGYILLFNLGEVEANGRRIADAAPGSSSGGGLLIGAWEMESVSQLGTLKRIIRITSPTTGTYESEDEKFEMRDIKIDGASLSFSVTVNVPDLGAMPLDFKGKLEDGTLTGEFSSPDLGDGIAQLKGKRMDN